MVVRRVAAAVVLLATALLLHLTVPHHGAARTVPVAVSAAEAESRKHSLEPVAGRAQQAPTAHEQSGADVTARLSRNVQPAAPPALVDVQTAAEADMAVAAAGPSRAGTPRDCRTPSTGAAPALSALQIFRC
ncbi:hypothetical protein ACQPXS_35565 [Streptomyces sp. CA-142005]|uniref:hypothetical protein n=1 Tax=Streptomyces sp. CA-142005 TaxID=3240052 RepID=UPI003D94B9E1